MGDQPERFVIEKDGDGFTARKPGVYGVEVGNGLGIDALNDRFVPLYEVKEPPGKPLPNRRERRAWAREQARALNHNRKRTVVAYQKED